MHNFILDIEELPSSIQEQLFEELLDRDAQKQLEEDSPIINWSLEITDRLGSRLYALWNRTAGRSDIISLLVQLSKPPCQKSKQLI